MGEIKRKKGSIKKGEGDESGRLTKDEKKEVDGERERERKREEKMKRGRSW